MTPSAWLQASHLAHYFVIRMTIFIFTEPTLSVTTVRWRVGT